MRRFAPASILVSLLLGSSVFWGQQPSVDQRVQALLTKMTLEEKVGQMTQVTIDMISKGPGGRAPHEIEQSRLETAIGRYHVGSILNVVDSAYSVDHWHDIITAIQDVATKKSRLRIPVIYGIDAIHGANYTLGATLFPQHLAMAATWNTELVRKEAEITAYEVRASGIPWNFNPVLDIGRNPLWPRLWETYGEDVYLASTLGREYIKGLQGENYGTRDKVAACMKHYMGYSFPWSGKDRTQAWISERSLREYFLPTFEAAIRGRAATLMVNSGEINGIPVHSDYHLLTEILRDELGFQGFVVSDWRDVERLHTRDRVAASPKEAVRMAVMAGVDMSMVPLDYSFFDLLVGLVKENAVPISRIDQAVSRILKVKYQLGLFEDPYPDRTLKTRFANEEFARVNLQAAQEAITLLKNEDNLLPLSKSARVVVTGPAATSLSSLNGGWTITWQGDTEALYPRDKMNILQAIRAKVGADKVTDVPGATFTKVLDIPAAVSAARNADAAVVCLGEKAYCETPGNIDDLTLDEAQLKLAEEIEKTGKPVILVLAEGRPRLIRRIADAAKAIVMAYLPGMEGGRAIADVLFGDVNPSGKLPITYPRFPNALMTYDHKPLDAAEGNQYNPQFPFGHGLSYTTFEYSDLRSNKEVMSANESLTVSVRVKNTGRCAGKEVFQLYLTDLYGSVSRPVKQLKRFAKIHLLPGQEQVVEFSLHPADLSFIGRENKRIVEPGDFRISIGPLSKGFAYK